MQQVERPVAAVQQAPGLRAPGQALEQDLAGREPAVRRAVLEAAAVQGVGLAQAAARAAEVAVAVVAATNVGHASGGA